MRKIALWARSRSVQIFNFMAIATIKTKLKALLESIVPATLGEVQVDDLKTSIFDRDIGAYPCAILTTPEVGADYLTNRENIRTYNFAVVVIQKRENISGANDIETLIETILNKFDNDPTLTGSADGGVEPSSSAPAAYESRGATFITFTIFVKAKESIPLTFS